MDVDTRLTISRQIIIWRDDEKLQLVVRARQGEWNEKSVEMGEIERVGTDWNVGLEGNWINEGNL